MIRTPRERQAHRAFVRSEGKLCRLVGRRCQAWVIDFIHADTGLTKAEVVREFRAGMNHK